jgi:biofilm PGA synthesis N-glycosyltransferase PgaC
VRFHWRSLLDLGYLRSMVTVAFWDALIASLAYVVLLPALAIAIDRGILLAYLIDAPVVTVPVVIQASRRRELRRALVSLPSFFVLRIVNSVFMLSALWRELVLGRSLLVYEKGH